MSRPIDTTATWYACYDGTFAHGYYLTPRQAAKRARYLTRRAIREGVPDPQYRVVRVTERTVVTVETVEVEGQP